MDIFGRGTLTVLQILRKISTMPSSLPRTRRIRISLISYGHVNGPIVEQEKDATYHRTLSYNIRHLPNPPRHLRVKATGLSRRLQREFLHNKDVEQFLRKVQGEVIDAAKEGVLYFQPPGTGDKLRQEQGTGECGESSYLDMYYHEETFLEFQDIDLDVKVCCEEGHHRSVAFVEELSRRLTSFKYGDNCSHHWQLIINITHRDIETPESKEQPESQCKRPKKNRSQTRPMGHFGNGMRYNMIFADNDGES